MTPSPTATSETQRTITANVRYILWETGWTQQELAERSGLPESRVSRLLNGNTVWRFRDMRRVAKAFRIDQARLLRPTTKGGAG